MKTSRETPWWPCKQPGYCREYRSGTAGLAEASGVDALDFVKEDVYDRIQKVTSGRGADACIHAVGTEPETRSDAVVDRVKVNYRRTLGFMSTGSPRSSSCCRRNAATVSSSGIQAGVHPTAKHRVMHIRSS
jgi:threonine dehydrogenase-like Zn-dependent dehydrogenase